MEFVMLVYLLKCYINGHNNTDNGEKKFIKNIIGIYIQINRHYLYYIHTDISTHIGAQFNVCKCKHAPFICCSCCQQHKADVYRLTHIQKTALQNELN